MKLNKRQNAVFWFGALAVVARLWVPPKFVVVNGERFPASDFPRLAASVDMNTLFVNVLTIVVVSALLIYALRDVPDREPFVWTRRRKIGAVIGGMALIVLVITLGNGYRKAVYVAGWLEQNCNAFVSRGVWETVFCESAEADFWYKLFKGIL